MLVTIQLDTSDKHDLEALTTLFGRQLNVPAGVTTAQTAAVAAPEEPKPAPKAKATPKAQKSVENAAAAVAAEVFAPVEEDLLGGDDPAALREKAVHTATELVTTGQSAKVREALTKFDAKRVSDLADGQLSDFLQAVSA